ncbi:MAG: aminoacyl-histidine dipeptidase [Gammaproteobacteria bacterium]|nr:aminoacyl-histidine dipeptidase [Gammaproteobacteria bacterium]
MVKSVGQIRAELGLLHGESEPGLELSVQPADDNRGALAPELEDGLLKFLFTVPNGVLAMSSSISGLVETSSNLGVMVTGEERIEISLCSRSSRGPALGLVGEQVAMIAGLCDLQYRREGGYPGWQPDPRSPLLRISRKVFRREAGGRDPEVTAIHAGLECGILGEVVPGLDMIAFGPDIQDAHSPNESVSIPSVGVVARQLGALLEALCNG